MSSNQRQRAQINKIKFYSINRDVKAALEAGRYNAVAIAEKQQVGASTVRAIRRAKTWPGFVEARKAVVRLRQERELAQGLKGLQSQPELPLQPIAEEPMTQVVTVTRQEFEGLYESVRKLRRRIEVLENRQPVVRRSIFGRRAR